MLFYDYIIAKYNGQYTPDEVTTEHFKIKDYGMTEIEIPEWNKGK